MAMVIVMVMLLERWGICYDGWRLRGLLYDICSFLGTWRLVVVCTRDSRGARRRATTVSSYDTGWDGIVVVIFFHTDQTHDGLCGGKQKWDGKIRKVKKPTTGSRCRQGHSRVATNLLE